MSRSDYFKFQLLLDRFLSGKITTEEHKEFLLLLEDPANRAQLDSLSSDQFERLFSQKMNRDEDIRTLNALMAAMREGNVADAPETPVRTRIFTPWRIAASVALFIAVSFGIHSYIGSRGDAEGQIVAEIVPGSNRATIELSNGEFIELNGYKNGIVVTGDKVVYQDGSEVKDENNEGSDIAASETLILSTPRGGQYQLTLSDGTKVWLNAATSLTYPRTFATNERIVELSGEAYFEVAKDASRPFRVVSAGQTIEVLGTHFNIAAYSDDEAIKTSLLEGSVRVTSLSTELILKPSEQAVLKLGGDFKIIKDVDVVSDAIAWKEGTFRFQDGDLGSILQQVSRWYDVEVAYADDGGESRLRDLKFVLVISREKNLAQVLHFIEMTGNVHFEIEGKTIVVKSGKAETGGKQ